MTRLTNDIRNTIMQKALDKAGITKAQEALDARRIEWEKAVWLDAIGGSAALKDIIKIQAKIKALIEQVPKHLRSGYNGIKSNHNIWLNLAGKHLRIPHHNQGTHKFCPEEHTITADHILSEVFERLENDRAELQDKRETVCGNVTGVLSQFNTVKQLVEAWPEAVELLPPVLPTRSNTLPMVPTYQLNKMLGLPGGIRA